MGWTQTLLAWLIIVGLIYSFLFPAAMAYSFIRREGAGKSRSLLRPELRRSELVSR
jgi:hypothetical protein